MQDSADRVAALRRLVAAPECGPGEFAPEAPPVALGHAPADALLSGGLARGALHEVFPARPGDETAACGFVAGLALRALAGGAAEAGLAWIGTRHGRGEDGLLWPAGLADWGLDPRRLLCVALARDIDALRAAEEALACPGLGAVVLEIRGAAPTLDLVAARRLALAARRGGLPCLLLRPGAAPAPGPAVARFTVAARPAAAGLRGLMGGPAFDVALVRHRAGVTATWSLEWDPDGCLFREPVSEPALSRAPDRPDHADRRRSA